MDKETRELYQRSLRRVQEELSLMKSKYEALQTTESGLQSLLEMDAGKQNQPSLDFHRGMFHGLTQKEACLSVLYHTNEALSTRQIADAIENTGFEHKSKNFWNAINTTLVRLADDGHIVKMDKGWGLSSTGHSFVMENTNIIPF